MKNVTITTPNRIVVVDDTRLVSGETETVSDETAQRIQQLAHVEAQVTDADDPQPRPRPQSRQTNKER